MKLLKDLSIIYNQEMKQEKGGEEAQCLCQISEISVFEIKIKNQITTPIKILAGVS